MKSLTKWITGGILSFAALITFNSSYYTLDQHEQAVVTQFGKPVKVVLNPISNNPAEKDALVDHIEKDIKAYTTKGSLLNPEIDASGAGWKWKVPFIQDVNTFDRRLQEWDGFPEEIPTKDKVYLHFDPTARWRITNPYIFFNTLQGLESNALAKLDDIIDGVLREEVSNRNAIESIRTSNRKMSVNDPELEETVKVEQIAEGRDKLVHYITEQVNKKCEQFGIAVEDFMIKRLVYVDRVKEKVEQRMISERKRISERYRSEGEGEYSRIQGEKERELKRIRSEAYRTAEEIKGKADRQAVKIYADGYKTDPEFYSFMQSLEKLKDAKNSTLIVGPDNELFKYLYKGDRKR